MATATIAANINATPPPNSALNLTEKTVMLVLSFGMIGNSKKVKTSEVEVDADKTLLRVSKKLIESPELEAVQSHRGKLKNNLRSIALPSFLKEGIYMIPIAAIQKIEDELKTGQAKDKELVDAFMAVYKQRAEETREKLKVLGETTDYPSDARVRACFVFEWSWTTFATPGKLKEISAGFFEAEQQKAATKWQQATEEITLLLRSQLKELVDHMIERLTPGDDGKPKTFHKTTVTNIKEFLDNFAIRNVTDDSQLDIIVKSAKQLLDGVDAETIRSNEAVRDAAQKGFGLVKQCLDGLVVEGGIRKITFENE